jgi:phosphinothricin acetyltransferase
MIGAMKPEIRLAAADDLPRILAISNWAAENTIANFATSPERLEDWTSNWQNTREFHPWLVGLVAGEVIGFAKSSPHRARGAYRWTAEVSVYLAEEWQGKGLAGALYEVLLPLLRRQGYVTLLAGISGGHLPSEKLHARFGFVRCATFHRVGWKAGCWLDVGYWELTLAGAEEPPPIRPVAEVWP